MHGQDRKVKKYLDTLFYIKKIQANVKQVYVYM